jgi:hypothetical protein
MFHQLSKTKLGLSTYPSLRKSGCSYHPSSTAQKHTGRSMATSCYTSGWKGQKINVCCISALQGKLLPPDKEEDSRTRDHLFVFLFRLFPTSPFITNITRALPLETIKGEARDTSRGGQGFMTTDRNRLL